VHLPYLLVLCYSLAYCRAACFFIGNYFFLLYAVYFSILEIYLALQKWTVKDRCRQQFVDYICPSVVFSWIWNYSIICFEFCFVSCSGGALVGRGRLLSCYRDLNFFPGCTCILKIFDEQRHLVGRF
jgi:hypothetical protein